MLLTELAVQNVRGFPASARLPLRPGLNALVARDADLVRLVRALLFPGPDDAETFTGEGTPSKAALTIEGRDGATWRLVRDFRGGRSLLRSDPATRQAVRVSDDPAGIQQHLQGTVGLPPEPILRAHLLLGEADLPSRLSRARRPPREVTLPPTATSTVGEALQSVTPDEARRRLPELRLELEKAERFEQAQDSLYGLQERLGQLRKAGEGLSTLDRELAALDQRLGAYARLNVSAGLEARLRKFPEAASRRDGALAELKKKREELEQQLGPEPQLAELGRDQLVLGGILAGVGCSVGAVLVPLSLLWLGNLLAFGAAAFGAWRWVDGAEQAERDRRRLTDLDDLQKRVAHQYELETKPVLTAMRDLAVGTPEEVVQKLQERDLLEARRISMQRDLEQQRADPRIQALERERDAVESDFREREALVNAMGFTRDQGAIRRELDACEDAVQAAAGEPDPLPDAIERTAELVGADPRAVLEQLRDRLAQYLGALTDRRFVGLKPIAPGVCHAVAANGASGPLNGLPPADRDLIVVAVRLALAERGAALLALPLVLDEPTLLIDAAHRPLLVRMLKTLAAQTQIVVRAYEAPPPGIVDHVVGPT